MKGRTGKSNLVNLACQLKIRTLDICAYTYTYRRETHKGAERTLRRNRMKQ